MLRSIFGLLICLSPLFAQADRYELGRRVHDLEVAWDTKLTDPAAKKRASPIVNQAVQNFFRLNFSGAAKSLDEARHQLLGDKPAPQDVRWADAICVWPEIRLLDGETTELKVVVRPFYKVDGAMPKGLSIRLTPGTDKPTEAQLGDFPQTIAIPLPKFTTDQDLILTSEILVSGQVKSKKQVAISRIAKLAKRLEAIAKTEEAACAEGTIERRTLEHHVKILNDLAKGTTLETDYPAARLIREAELLFRTKEDVFNDKGTEANLWLSLPTPKSSSKSPVVVRVGLPKTLAKPVPVVVVLHGMGGSENMFFDAYGNGVIPKMAVERGWIVVATRAGGLLGAGPSPDVNSVISELAKRYPIDTKRVLLVGHSMGAGHVTQLASQTPETFAAVACLGGGRGVGKADGLKSLPFFVGCGSADFALGGAKALHQSVEKLSGISTLKIYDDIEHLAIVREAADDVFKFFETHAKGK